MSERKKDPSYEWVILRDGNIKHIASITGHSTHDLKLMLAAAKRDGRFEVRIPIGVPLFTREER